MLAQWAPTGGGAVYLVDDNGTGGVGAPKIRGHMEQEGAEGQEQLESLAFAANPALYARGNVYGPVVFTARQSFATRAAASDFVKTMRGYVMQQGTLVITVDTSTRTYAGAVLKSAYVTDFNGTELTIRYTFTTTTCT